MKIPRFLYKCKPCGVSAASHSSDGEDCIFCEQPMIRDWKAEAVGFSTVPGGYKESNRGR